MKARLLKKQFISALYADVQKNLKTYREGNFDYLLNDMTAFVEIDLEVDEVAFAAVKVDSENRFYDNDNCLQIFNAYARLTPYLARDERLWVYLTHTYFLSYARERWPIPADDLDAVDHIRIHFFGINGRRGIERDNAISRLWWIAYLCSKATEFSLEYALELFLYRSDVRANILERPTTSQSTEVLNALFKQLDKSYRSDRRVFERSVFRPIMENLNLVGGYKLLSSLDDSHIETEIEKCLIIPATESEEANHAEPDV